MQFLNDTRKENIEWSDEIRSSVLDLLRDGGTLAPLDGVATCTSIDAARALVKAAYESEIPTRRPMTSRGIQNTSVKVFHCDTNGKPLRPWNNNNSDVTSATQPRVIVAKCDTLSVLKYLHPEGHYRTPHGKRVRVLSSHYNRRDSSDSTRWLQELTSVSVTPLRLSDANFKFLTKGVFEEEVQRNFRGPTESIDGGATFGVIVRTVTWKGYYYVNPYTMRRVKDEPFVEPQCRASQFFRQPVENEHCGWKVVALDSIQRDPVPGSPGSISDDEIKACANMELRIRAAEVLKCSPAQIQFDTTWICLRCYEMAPSGLAREAHRKRRQIISMDATRNDLRICSDELKYAEMMDLLRDFETRKVAHDIKTNAASQARICRVLCRWSQWASQDE